MGKSKRSWARAAQVSDLEGRLDGQRYVYALIGSRSDALIDLRSDALIGKQSGPLADGASCGHIGTSQRPPAVAWHCHEATAMNPDPRGISTRFMWDRPQSAWVRERGGRFELRVLEVLRPGDGPGDAKLRWQARLSEDGLEVPAVARVPGPVTDRWQGKISGRLKGRRKTAEHSGSMSRGRRAKSARLAGG